MYEVVLAGRTMVVRHAHTERSVHGDVQHYVISISGSDTATDHWTLRQSSAADARVVASIIDTELLLDYKGSHESGMLRDPRIREWRDQHRGVIMANLRHLQHQRDELPPESLSNEARKLLDLIEFGKGAGGE